MDVEQVLELGFVDLGLMAMVGVYEAELRRQQRIYLSVRLRYTPSALVHLTKNDELQAAIDYQAIADWCVQRVKSRHWNLIETLAMDLAGGIIALSQGISWVEIKIRKPKGVAGSKGSFACFSLGNPV